MNSICCNNKEDITKYAECLSTFCYFVGQLSKFSKMAEAGEVLDEEKVVFAVECVEKLKTLLLRRKEAIGLTDGLAFLENNRFKGFEIENGKFSGDNAELEKVINPWVCGFPDMANHYSFEVSNYLLYLANPDIIDLYPKRLHETFSKEKEAKIKCRRKRMYFPFNLLSSVQEVLGHTS